ncbi:MULTISPECIES: DUF222 domain-containing protein [unclassified Pseudoclavibacter]|uniref:DUF222 domain-containing protein n=1 Tax=unclassified Pseudoclavibacter TaxID=2615177 RepID=UPI001BA44556|nr:DUF222 domain-containing protein [Pseudoclavibacter sp. Marseille-Q4354]MBS3178161.1 hypothetical protein [Pseudoclavibacter sp. Marseille-Q4354]
MYSYDGEPLKVLGLDPHDPASVDAWRKFLLDWDADLAVMAAIVAADQVRVRAKLEEMASVLDALDGTAEHAMHVQSVAAEVALIEQVGQSAAEGALSDAGIAVREFPGLVDALGEGSISEEQLRVLTGAGLSVSHVDSVEQGARRGEFVRVMLAELGSRVLPPKALRMAAARVAESLTEESVSERHERARKTRYVSVTATENGMCLLRARLPLIEGTAIADRLRKQGKALIKARPKPEREIRQERDERRYSREARPVRGRGKCRCRCRCWRPRRGACRCRRPHRCHRRCRRPCRRPCRCRRPRRYRRSCRPRRGCAR